ncbi:hypothetical protein ACFU99_06185 [Streptomyces sp. NPDC057654]|uniref:hypothetical protein n=1 Tax=Streptomyces sp. NPDC057654 TaxID=3346196 RepID=UPI0036AF59C3
MGKSMITAAIAFPAECTEPPNFDRGRQMLDEITDASLFIFDEPERELCALLPNLDGESDLVDKDGEVLIDYARRAGLVIIDNLEKALDFRETGSGEATYSREIDLFTVAGYRIYISGGLSGLDAPTNACQAFEDAYKLPKSVFLGMGFIWDCYLPLSRANGSGDHTPPTDTDVVDAIALGLGTSSEWPGTDTLKWIAEVIGTVRDEPGSRDPREYREAFAAERAFDPREDGFLAKYTNEETTEGNED